MKCYKCKLEKEKDCFYEYDLRRKNYICKECRGKQSEQWHKNNPDKVREIQKRYNRTEKGKEKSRRNEKTEKGKARRARYIKKHPVEIAERARKYRLKNADKIRENREKYINSETGKAKCRNYVLKQQYGIDLQIYNQMFEQQNGCCAICGKHQSELKIALAVDHDHKTGKIRGLLCRQCNLLIGNSNESVDVLKKATTYLESV